MIRLNKTGGSKACNYVRQGNHQPLGLLLGQQNRDARGHDYCRGHGYFHDGGQTLLRVDLTTHSKQERPKAGLMTTSLDKSLQTIRQQVQRLQSDLATDQTAPEFPA